MCFLFVQTVSCVSGGVIRVRQDQVRHLFLLSADHMYNKYNRNTLQCPATAHVKQSVYQLIINDGTKRSSDLCSRYLESSSSRMRTSSAASLSPPTRWRPWRRSLTAAVTTWRRSSAGPETTWTRWGISSAGEDSVRLWSKSDSGDSGQTSWQVTRKWGDLPVQQVSWLAVRGVLRQAVTVWDILNLTVNKQETS